jgi:hypothetical protein
MRKHVAMALPLVAAAALLFAAPGYGQQAGAPPKPAVEAPKPALATPEKPESSEPPAVKRRYSRRHVDARECLRFETNMEIHRCSLKYL